MRATARVQGVGINTVARLFERCSEAALGLHDERVRGLTPRRLELDEIWAFIYAKQGNLHRAKAPPPGAGDVWAWTAIDPDTRLIVSWLVGDRDQDAADAFVHDVRSRVEGSPQITTDGFGPYIDSVTGEFGRGVDFAQLVKVFDGEDMESTKKIISGDPDPALISTSKVERQNFTIRMTTRRYTRKTNAHSKSLHRHRLALDLHFFWYNFCRPHMSLGTTPAVAAGLAEAPVGLNQLIGHADSARPPRRRWGTNRLRGRQRVLDVGGGVREWEPPAGG